MDYCPEKCACGGTCKLTSNHGHRLGKWEHICDSNKAHTWPVKYVPNKNDM